jgi:NAD(P)-dependent dehydrogenase (short-subunit alcohol dehydrogenase family)
MAQVALVGGGTGGLGRAVTLAFLQRGDTVWVPYHRQETFDDLRKEAGDGASRLNGESVDVTKEAETRALVERIEKTSGRLDILVNCVGGYAAGAKLWEFDPAAFEQMLALNLRAGFMLCRAAVPAMLRNNHGAIVNVAAKAAVDHAGSAAAYAASKAAAVAMIDSLAADLKGTGVRANSILPTIIDTKANREAMPKADFSKWPKPEEIAKVILFLCGEEAALVNGASIIV